MSAPNPAPLGGIFLLATIVLAVLKVAGVLAISWLVVLLPVIVAIGLSVLGLILALVIAAVAIRRAEKAEAEIFAALDAFERTPLRD